MFLDAIINILISNYFPENGTLQLTKGFTQYH